MYPVYPVYPCGPDQRKPGIHVARLCIPAGDRCDRATPHGPIPARKPARSDGLCVFQPYPSTHLSPKGPQRGSQRAGESLSPNDKEIPTNRHTSTLTTPHRPTHAAQHHAWRP